MINSFYNTVFFIFYSEFINLVCTKFATINNCQNPFSNSKCKAKLLGPVEKARKILSANKETSILVENFYEDNDLSF